MKQFDIVVIGAGPAGIAAGLLANEHGATVAVIDEQAAGGGQVYRAGAQAGETRAELLGADYQSGRELVNRLEQASLTFVRGATVWDLTDKGVVTYSAQGLASQLRAKVIILATGALERPVPIEGWTLPGVMSVGAAQILLKSSGLVPQSTVLAGSGPLLYLLAVQLIAADCPPIALVETQSSRNALSAARYFPSALGGRHLLLKGLSMLSIIRKARVPRYRAATDLRIVGEQAVSGFTFRQGGKEIDLTCATVLLHQGVVPNTQVTRALQLDHVWDDAQYCFRPVLNKWGQSSCENVYVAGDGSRIRGAGAAVPSGCLSALGALHQLGRLDQTQRDQLSQAPRRALQREEKIRPFLDALYAPPTAVRTPADNTIICRCERVTAGDIRRYASLGCTGPNQTKAYGRCGMGPCQGRGCALTVTEILAAEHGLPHDAVGTYRIRAPLKPVTLGEVASIDDDDQ